MFIPLSQVAVTPSSEEKTRKLVGAGKGRSGIWPGTTRGEDPMPIALTSALLKARAIYEVVSKRM